MTESTIRWEKDADNIVTLILDDPQQSANTMNERYTRSMHEMVERLEKEKADTAGVIITSAKSTFFAGGDLKDLIKVTKDDAQKMADGGKTYRLRLPPNIPVKDFWSVIVYDTQTRSMLQTEQTRNAGMNQALADFELRLQDKDEQIRSLEEKHLHARDALEHYRQASKEQREQEQRRHETQVQQVQVELRQLQQTLIVKQDELTQINRDKLHERAADASSTCVQFLTNLWNGRTRPRSVKSHGLRR